MSAFVAVWLRRTGLLLAVAALGLLVALLLVGGRPGPAAATTTLLPTLTFEGNAGGGTIRITTTADRSAIVAAAVEGVSFSSPECPFAGTASGSAYMGSTAPVADGNFAFSFAFIDGIAIPGFVFSGSFAGENSIQGTTTPLSCESAAVPWTLTGPTKTIPGPDEQLFIGPAGGGNFAIVTDLGGTQITGVILESVFFGPGPGVQTPCGEITASVPLTPPAQISPGDSSFQFSFSLGAGLTVNVSGKLAGQAASASLFLKSLPCNGGGAEWTGTLIPAGGQGPPACITGDLSGSWDMKTQHGTGTEGHFEFILTLVQTNGLLSGTMVDGIQITSIMGALNGDVVTFGRLIGVGGPTERTQTYDGFLTSDGTTIAGTFIDPKSPLVGTWVATANCAVGGVAFEPNLGALALTAPEPSNDNSRLSAGIAAAVATGVVALAGAAWYARKRVTV